MASNNNKTMSLNGETLLTRKEVCEILHIGLSSLDSIPLYKNGINRIRMGRHTLFLRSDIESFILEHRTGGAK